MRKSKGPKILPWGTPGVSSDYYWLLPFVFLIINKFFICKVQNIIQIWSKALILVRKSEIHSNNKKYIYWPLIPWCWHFSSRCWWDTLLKAFAKPRKINIASTEPCSSRILSHSWTSWSSSVTHEQSVLKPCWLIIKYNLLSERKLIIWLSISHSKD